MSVGAKEIFYNASQPSDKYYLVYGDMLVSEIYLFRVFAYQNGVASAPSPTSDLLINGVNGEWPPELGEMKLLASTFFACSLPHRGCLNTL